MLAYQQPNAKKLRRKAQRAEQLAAKGVVTRRQKQLLNRRPVDRAAKKSLTEANNNPDRDFYDIWGQECECVCLSNDDRIFARQYFLNGNVKKMWGSDDCCVNGYLGSEDKL